MKMLSVAQYARVKKFTRQHIYDRLKLGYISESDVLNIGGHPYIRADAPCGKGPSGRPKGSKNKPKTEAGAI